MPSITEFLDELPSIDDFLEAQRAELGVESNLPSIDQYLAHEPAVRPAVSGGPSAPSEYDAEGWAIAGWQSFDWSGAAALGLHGSQSLADESWSTLDWGETAVRPAQAGQASHEGSPSADEVARALDNIARRIRSGELALDQLSGTPPEVALAAGLAALLRLRS